MPIIITSTTDSPEDVASAMGAELEGQGEGEQNNNNNNNDNSNSNNESGDGQDGKNNQDGKDEKDGQNSDAQSGQDGQEGQDGQDDKSGDNKDDKKDGQKGKAKVDGESGDDDDDENEDDDANSQNNDQSKPKKLTGYKKKYYSAREENKLLLDLLKTYERPGDRSTNDADDTDGEQAGGDKSGTKTYSGIPAPKLEDFKDEPDQYAAFTAATSKWAVDEAVAKIKAEQSATSAKTQEETAKSNFNARLNEVRKDDGIYADYDDVLESIKHQDLPVTPLMYKMIMDSKAKGADGKPIVISTDVMYYLASNPDHCREASKLPADEQAAEMGVIRTLAWAETQRRIQAKSSKTNGKDDKDGSNGKDNKNKNSQSSQSSAGDGKDGNSNANSNANAGTGSNKPKPKTTPPPINPVGKRSSPAAQDLSKLAESGNFAAYEAQRRAQGFKYK